MCHAFVPVEMGQASGSRTRHMGKHVSIHSLQAISTKSQLRKIGHVPKHIRWQVIQTIVPQVEFLVQNLVHLFLCHYIDQCTIRNMHCGLSEHMNNVQMDIKKFTCKVT